jgi:hypothetical protein
VELPQAPLPKASTSQSISIMEGGINNNPSPHINMLHMQLIHHFGAFTAETLVFDTDLWRNEVMRLSFKVYSRTFSVGH